MKRITFQSWSVLWFATVCLGWSATYGLGSSPAHDVVQYLTGTDLSPWKAEAGDWQVIGDVSLNPDDPKKLSDKPGAGILLNGLRGKTVDLISRDGFGDCEVHIEFLIPKDSNSGVYFMGRYEVQIFDSHQKESEYPGMECGGIYQRWDDKRNPKGYEGHSPKVNASKPPGEWQTLDAVFRAPKFDADGKKTANACFVKVLHNGVLIHENVGLTGPTRGSLFQDEKQTGPLRLQGDHGPVAFRNIWIRSRSEKSRPVDPGRSWESLFDGKTLKGWFLKPGGRWEVQNGTLSGTSSKSENRYGLIVTEKRYRDFTARLKFKAMKGNSGFYFRADTVTSFVSVNGVQAEIDAQKDVGGLYETAGRSWVVQPDPESVKQWFKPEEWNDMVVSALGRHIRVWINGHETAEVINDPGRIEGHFGLQLHANMEMQVMFRDIQISLP